MFILCMFPVICHRALLVGILSEFIEKLSKDTNNSLNIFVENIVLELNAFIFDKRVNEDPNISESSQPKSKRVNVKFCI